MVCFAKVRRSDNEVEQAFFIALRSGYWSVHVDYLISSLARYRSDDGTIWPVSDEDSVIILTATMNRLLAYLLERQGQVINRDELLDNVWDLHGLRSSNHTLNKYISEIRKYFVSTGIQAECITTVPRIGFMFNQDIEVVVMTDTFPVHESVTTTDCTGAGIKRRYSAFSAKHRIIFNILLLAMFAASAAIFIAGSQIPATTTSALKDIQTHFLFNYQNCPVYTIQKNSISFLEKKKDVFVTLARQNNIDCLDGAVFLYQASDAYIYGSKGRVFISRCTTKDKQYISCLNNYWNGYESN
ncbi:winged helix-turn-helix domain-containing protein [Citrobacter braakii]|uniref:winged helix-turn-helix domain-containing protein n=1 Tax=Citrobacter braakii TaxID=57706 RepID=UPI0021652EF0|nr:winged helix-turn-helix domain-containing protein [Citrobacter braakii]